MNAAAASQVRPLCASCRVLPASTFVLVGKGNAERRMHLCAICKQLKTAGIARVREEQRQGVSLLLSITNLVCGGFHVERNKEASMNKRSHRNKLAARSGAMVAEQPVRLNCAHTTTHVVMLFSRPVSNFTMTEEQTEAAIANLQATLKVFREFKAKAA